ncbi:hypothetical protein [Rufibacter sp. LB8]|nr:hypothetical protein [Rufibacter sp. LB8]
MEKNLFKSPYHEWTKYQFERQNKEEILEYNWKDATGVGVILGHQNLRALDIDGCVSLEFIDKVLETLQLPLDYPWVMRSGSGNGFHIFILL